MKRIASVCLVGILGLKSIAFAERPWQRLVKTETVGVEATRKFGWSFRAGQTGVVHVTSQGSNDLRLRVVDGTRILAEATGPACHLSVTFIAPASATYSIQVENRGDVPIEFTVDVLAEKEME